MTRCYGDRAVPRLIAEIGSNHNRDLARCIELIERAARAGCGAVKLQVFRVQDLFAPEALVRHPQLRERQAWEFPLDFLPDVRAACDRAGVQLGAAVFSLDLVGGLEPWVDWLKVASYEVLWSELIEACASTGKPLVISTGMATLDEVASAVEAARRAGCSDLRLFHCVSGYPTPPDQCNLAAIDTLRNAFACPVGWSDHSRESFVVVRSVAHWGASDVELHVDLDGTGYEAGAHCWSIGDVERLVRELDVPQQPQTSAHADGDGVKAPMPIELADVNWRADPLDGLRPVQSQRAALSV